MNISSASNSPFTINVRDGSNNNWTVEITESGGNITVEVYANSVSQGSKAVTSTQLKIGQTRGTINGSDWSPLDFSDGVTQPYSKHYEDGDRAVATYQLVVDRPYSDVDPGPNDEYLDPGTDPTLYSAIYNTTLEYSFTRDDLHYSSNVTLAPEGPPPE